MDNLAKWVCEHNVQHITLFGGGRLGKIQPYSSNQPPSTSNLWERMTRGSLTRHTRMSRKHKNIIGFEQQENTKSLKSPTSDNFTWCRTVFHQRTRWQCWDLQSPSRTCLLMKQFIVDRIHRSPRLEGYISLNWTHRAVDASGYHKA